MSSNCTEHPVSWKTKAPVHCSATSSGKRRKVLGCLLHGWDNFKLGHRIEQKRSKFVTRYNKSQKIKIQRDFAWSLAHIDCHYLPKGIVKSNPTTNYYVIGVIDDYSRIVWVEVLKSIKSIDAMFAMMDAMLIMKNRYDITFEEALTDNGSEFCGSEKTKEKHPFERLLMHFNIKHIRTKPYRPQTNGKIERFWRTFDEDVIDGVEFPDIDALKDAVLGYNFFYNEFSFK